MTYVVKMDAKEIVNPFASFKRSTSKIVMVSLERENFPSFPMKKFSK